MKKRSILYLFLLTLACTSNTENKADVASQNTELIKQYFIYFNNHQWDKMASMYSDTSEFKDPSLGPGIVTQTRQQIQEKYSLLNQMFPDIKDEIVEVYPSGDKHVIVEFVSRGTAPDSSKFELPISTIFTIENGLITKDFTYYDNFEE